VTTGELKHGDYPEPHTGILLNTWISWATHRKCSEYVTILSHIQ